MRPRGLRSVRQGVLALALTTKVFAAPPGLPRSNDAAEPKLVTPAHSPGGVLALSLSAAALTGGKAVFKDEGTDGGEGSASGGFAYAVSYQRPIFPLLSLKGFAQRAGWSTHLSELNGDGDRALYDIGAAPVLTLPLSSGARGVSFLLSVPISFSLSHAPARAPRDVVREEMSLGTGYRVGLSAAWLLRISRHLAWLIQVEHARQRVAHERTYRFVDGTSGEATQSVAFHLSWLSASVGLAILP